MGFKKLLMEYMHGIRLARGTREQKRRERLERKEFKDREKEYKKQAREERDKKIKAGIKKGGHFLITIFGIIIIIALIMLSGIFSGLASILNVITSSIGPVLTGVFSLIGLNTLPGTTTYSFIQLEITILTFYFTALFFIAIYHLLIWKRPQKSLKILTQILFWATIINIVISFVFANPIGAWQSGEESLGALWGGVTQPFKVGSCSFQSALGGAIGEECVQLLQKNENEVVETQKISVRGTEYPSTIFDYRSQDDTMSFIFEFETTNVDIRVTKHECYANTITEGTDSFFEGASKVFSQEERLFENELIYEEEHDETISRKRTKSFECKLDQLMEDRDAIIAQLEVKVFFEADNEFSQTVPTVMCENPEIESYLRVNRYNSCQDITWDELGEFVDTSQLQNKAIGGNAIRIDTRTLGSQFPLHLAGDSDEERKIRSYFIFRDGSDIGLGTKLTLEELIINDITLPNTMEQLSTEEYNNFVGNKVVEEIGGVKQASEQLTLIENEDGHDQSLPVSLQDLKIETTSTISSSLLTNSIFFRTPNFEFPVEEPEEEESNVALS